MNTAGDLAAVAVFSWRIDRIPRDGTFVACVKRVQLAHIVLIECEIVHVRVRPDPRLGCRLREHDVSGEQ